MNFDQCFDQMTGYQKTAEKIIRIYQEAGAFGEENKGWLTRFAFKNFAPFRAVDRITIHCEYRDVQESIIIPKDLLDNYSEEKAKEHARTTVESLLKMEKDRLNKEEQGKEIALLKQLQIKYPEIGIQ